MLSIARAGRENGRGHGSPVYVAAVSWEVGHAGSSCGRDEQVRQLRPVQSLTSSDASLMRGTSTPVIREQDHLFEHLCLNSAPASRDNCAEQRKPALPSLARQ